MTYEPNNDDAIQALDDYVLAKKDLGFAVISPGDGIGSGAYAVTVNSGNLDAADTLSVGTNGDEALFNGSTVSLSGSTNVQINSVSDATDGTEQYRYDVIWIDSNGEVNKTEGSVVKLSQEESNNNLTRFQRFKAEIPFPATDPATVIAAVNVNSNDSSVGTANLKDYRVDALSQQNTTQTNELNGGVTGSTTVTSILGDGIEVVSNTLQAALGSGLTISGGDIQAALGDGLDFASGNIQILDSIWDAGNSELTADVNNTNTTTDTLEADRWYTPSGSTFADIQSSFDSGIDYIKLDPSVTYTGDTTVLLDASGGRDVFVDARGCTLDKTGGSGPIFEIPNHGGQPGDEFVGSVEIAGGYYSAQGTGSGAVLIEDSFNNDVHIEYVENAEYGVRLRNVDQWSEKNYVRCDGSTQDSVKNLVSLVGASSTGGTGTDSFRGTHIEIQSGWSWDAVVDTDSVSCYNATFDIETHLSNGATGIRLDGYFGGSTINFRGEDTIGGNGSIGVEIMSGTTFAPTGWAFFVGLDNDVVNNGGDSFRYFRTGNGQFEFFRDNEKVRTNTTKEILFDQLDYRGGNLDMSDAGAGKGVHVTTPDGSDVYRIRVDNSGNVTTDLI